MSRPIEQEAQLWRQASYPFLLEQTEKVQQLTEAALEQVLPRLTPPYRDYLVNREITALLKLTEAVRNTLEKSPKIQTAALSVLTQTEAADLPDHVRAEWHRARIIQDVLFDPRNNDFMVRAYIVYALEKAEGEETTLKQFKEGWDQVCDEARQINRMLHPNHYELTNGKLPARSDLKRGGSKSVKGWLDTRHNHEAGKKAVIEIMAVMEDGRQLQRG